ncbi:hypothetical protein R1sor_020680 [Riccia sorocarpa]|uniref:Kinetochore protein NDC80 n=1 Tax=Riccia sorocarpa TaxID=122646 RepID=A0ABD3GJ37_9MARC
MNGRSKASRGSNGITNRPSLGRRSSIMGKGAGAPTDTRAIGDRAFQQVSVIPPEGFHFESCLLNRSSRVFCRRGLISSVVFQECIRTLCNFLTTRNYPNAVSPKVLQAPSGKDVTSIIQFLFHQVDPLFKFSKLEEDVPLVFKRLGYPVQISRSALYAAGSPTSWPPLLAALTWLVNLLTAMESSWDGSDILPFEDVRHKQLDDHLKKAYNHWLAGSDREMYELDDEFLREYELERERDAAELDQRLAELETLKAELEQAGSKISPLADAESKKKDYQDDIVKFQNIILGFAAHKQTLEKKVNEKKQEFATKEEEILKVLKGNEELKETVASQQDYAASVERMLKEKEINNLNLESVLSRREELEKLAWNLEVQSSKMLRDLETQVGQFNDGGERLKSMVGEELLDSCRFEMKVQPRGETVEEILGNTRKTIIKTGLVEMTQKCRKKLTEELEPETLNHRQEFFAKKLALDTITEKVASEIAHHKKLELQYEGMVEKLNQTLASIIAEREGCERRVFKEDAAFQKMKEDLVAELKEREVKFANTVRECNEELQLRQSQAGQDLEIIMSSYEENVQILKRVDEVNKQTTQLFDDLCMANILD